MFASRFVTASGSFLLWLSLFAPMSAEAIKKVRNFSDYEKVDMEMTAIPPSPEDLKNSQLTVGIDIGFTEDPNSGDLNAYERAAVSLKSNLSRFVNQLDLQVVPDGQVDRAVREVGLRSESFDPDARASIAKVILADVENIAFSSEYREKGSMFTFKRDELVGCVYSGTVRGSLRVYDSFSRELSNTVVFEGRGTGFESGQCNSRAQNIDPIVDKATEDAIQAAAAGIGNELAPIGYVVGRRTHKNNSLFRVSFGESMEMENVKEVEILQIVRFKNDLTGETEIDIEVVATGEVSDQTTQNYTFVFVKNKDGAEQVRLGDMARLRYQKKCRPFDPVCFIRRGP